MTCERIRLKSLAHTVGKPPTETKRHNIHGFTLLINTQVLLPHMPGQWEGEMERVIGVVAQTYFLISVRARVKCAPNGSR